MNGGEEIRRGLCQSRERASVGFVVLAVALGNEAESSRIGNNDFMAQFFENPTDPRGMGATFESDSHFVGMAEKFPERVGSGGHHAFPTRPISVEYAVGALFVSEVYANDGTKDFVLSFFCMGMDGGVSLLHGIELLVLFYR